MVDSTVPPSYSAGFVIGYHGCDRALAERVLAGEANLMPSRNTYDWLGGGVYFFEGSVERALHFARTAHEQPARRLTARPITRPFVLGAVIELGRCLDLSRRESWQEVAGAYELLVTARSRDGARLPANEAADDADTDYIVRKLDRAIFEMLHQARQELGLPPYDTVRSPFLQGPPIARNSGLRPFSHVQIAVRSPQQIRGFFVPDVIRAL